MTKNEFLSYRFDSNVFKETSAGVYSAVGPVRHQLQRQGDFFYFMDPYEYLNDDSQSLAFDAASRIDTAGYTHDAQGRVTATPRNAFSWDGASRLTGIDAAALTCNGLGQLRTRTEGGVTTHYYYNHAIGGTPIVAERNPNTGRMLRYYVWIPGGRLLCNPQHCKLTPFRKIVHIRDKVSRGWTRCRANE